MNIYDFAHPSSLGSILITSRSQDTGRIGKELEAQEVTEDEAFEILWKSVRRDTAASQQGMEFAAFSASGPGTLTHSELG